MSTTQIGDFSNQDGQQQVQPVVVDAAGVVDATSTGVAVAGVVPGGVVGADAAFALQQQLQQVQIGADGADVTQGTGAGVAKWFDVTRGFGFITLEDGTDLFVHHKSIHNAPNMRGLVENEQVEFTVQQTATGLRAINVTGPGGRPVIGVPGVGNERSNRSQRQIIVPTGPPVNGMKAGLCKWFNTTKGFGFITPNDGGMDVFVHLTAIYSRDPSYRTLMQGEHVEYSTFVTEEGRLKAQHVTGPGGQPVVGQEDTRGYGRYRANPHAGQGYGQGQVGDGQQYGAQAAYGGQGGYGAAGATGYGGPQLNAYAQQAGYAPDQGQYGAQYGAQAAYANADPSAAAYAAQQGAGQQAVAYGNYQQAGRPQQWQQR